MALAPRLDLRQSQGLVMTPQLQQAIRLLALPNLEVAEFLAETIAGNPLLELGEATAGEAAPGQVTAGEATGPDADPGRTTPDRSPIDALIAEGRVAADRPLDMAGPTADGEEARGGARHGAGEPWSQGEDAIARAASPITLAEHLRRQLGAMRADPAVAAIASALIDDLDDAGYLSTPLPDLAAALGVPLPTAEAALALVQGLEPTGVGSRGLAECLALQAREADRYDPCMARLLDNLDLLVRGALAQLKRCCEVDDEDLAEMLAELRGYDPKPGLRFGQWPPAIVVPDILVRAAPAGGWDIALNPATLPRVLVDRSYYLELRRGCAGREARAWLGDKLAEARGLVRALDQRQRTILRVAGEIVRRQDGFFRRGAAGLGPLTLRTVADALGLHESTVSRVAAHKSLQCERGTFELKYFFASPVASAAGGDAASAETVKLAIRTLIDGEPPGDVLSDDVLVGMLREKGYVLARRTVAKYRESIGLGSSVERRRQKALGIRLVRSSATG
jgi:RNA polymerase sigma-54 factor